MATSAIRSATRRPRPGRNEALTRQARAPSRRSRLAGCTWSASNGRAAVTAPLATRASIDWQGKMPALVTGSGIGVGHCWRDPGSGKSERVLPQSAHLRADDVEKMTTRTRGLPRARRARRLVTPSRGDWPGAERPLVCFVSLVVRGISPTHGSQQI